MFYPLQPPQLRHNSDKLHLWCPLRLFEDTLIWCLQQSTIRKVGLQNVRHRFVE